MLHGAGIITGLDTTEEEGRERPMQKAKMEIILTKSPQFDELMAAATSQQPPQQQQQQQQQQGGGGGQQRGSAPPGSAPPSEAVDRAGSSGAGPSRQAQVRRCLLLCPSLPAPASSGALQGCCAFAGFPTD